MPKKWDFPDELFAVNMPSSENKTVSFCDAIVRKANLLNHEYRGSRKPDYLKSKDILKAVKNKKLPSSPKLKKVSQLGLQPLQADKTLDSKQSGFNSQMNSDSKQFAVT
jgi:hypothetical protein